MHLLPQIRLRTLPVTSFPIRLPSYPEIWGLYVGGAPVNIWVTNPPCGDRVWPAVYRSELLTVALSKS